MELAEVGGVDGCCLGKGEERLGRVPFYRCDSNGIKRVINHCKLGPQPEVSAAEGVHLRDAVVSQHELLEEADDSCCVSVDGF